MIDLKTLQAELSYDQNTGKFSWRNAAPGRRRSGIVGHLDRAKGYRRINVLGRMLYAHRLAWLYMTGEWPNQNIDHINGNKDDNRWSNLRVATKSQNGCNRGVPANNTSGYKGVYWHKERRKWCANIRLDGRKVHLGLFDNVEQAAAAYDSAATVLHKQYAKTNSQVQLGDTNQISSC